MKISNFPTLNVNNFLLREIQQSDITQIFAGLSHADVIAYYGISYSTLAETQIQINWFKQILADQTGVWWGICSLDDEKIIGACGFNHWNHDFRCAEIGYWLLPAYWRQGIAFACINKILDYGFNQMNLHRVEAQAEPENIASCKLLQRIGFTYEGTKRQCEIKHSVLLSLNIYSYLKPEFLSQHLSENITNLN